MSERVILPVLSIQATDRHCGSRHAVCPWLSNDCAWDSDASGCRLFGIVRQWSDEEHRWTRLPVCVAAEQKASEVTP
jgi:hypothetical protein